MKFNSKTEAYSYAILLIHQLKAKKLSKNMNLVPPFDRCIGQLKASFENHEQNPLVVVNHLEELKKSAKLLAPEIAQINQLQHDLMNNNYRQTTNEKFQNPLARRAESEIALVLLQKPTWAMMTAVKRISNQLLKVIEDDEAFIKRNLDIFVAHDSSFDFGALKAPIKIEDIKTLLKNNDPTNLVELMHIHFTFARCITRNASLKHAECREPVGKLAEIVKSIWNETKDPKDFFSRGVAKGSEGKKYRAYIADELMYHSDLYTAPGHRGRGFLNDTLTRQSGLMLWGQEEHEQGFPKFSTPWCADCKNQSPNYSTSYVLDLIENDSVYVSGPSGMTSMLLSQMEILANFENEDLKKNYLSAVVSYIVSGGLHSIHEVIGPAEKALGLVPGYKIKVPSDDYRAPPPNFNQFYIQQESIDPDFASRRELAWQNYLNYVNDSYAPKYIEGFQHEKINFPQLNIELPGMDQISKNINLQDKDEESRTALDRAANKPECLKLKLNIELPDMEQISKNINFQDKDKKGRTALDRAANNPECLKLILEQIPEEQRLEVLMSKDKYDNTILHGAAWNLESLKILLKEIPTDQCLTMLDSKNKHGYTVRYLAGLHPECLKFILEKTQKEVTSSKPTFFSIGEKRKVNSPHPEDALFRCRAII